MFILYIRLLTHLVCRFSMGDADSELPWVLHMGMGKPSSSSPDVLCKFYLLTWRLLPHCHLQFWSVQEHFNKPRPTLYCLGQTSKATSTIPFHQRLQQNGKKWYALCSEVWKRRSSFGQNWPWTLGAIRWAIHPRWVVQSEIRWGRTMLIKGWGVQVSARSGCWKVRAIDEKAYVPGFPKRELFLIAVWSN